MPFEVLGWVEVAWGVNDPFGWQTAIHIGALVGAADEVSERLFGLSKRVVAGEFAIVPLAGNRGLPSNPSRHVKQEAEAIAAHEAKHTPGEFGGFTHATWREIKAARLDPALVTGSDWGVVFELVRRLEESGRWSDEQLRFVVWYGW